MYSIWECDGQKYLHAEMRGLQLLMSVPVMGGLWSGEAGYLMSLTNFLLSFVWFWKLTKKCLTADFALPHAHCPCERTPMLCSRKLLRGEGAQTPSVSLRHRLFVFLAVFLELRADLDLTVVEVSLIMRETYHFENLNFFFLRHITLSCERPVSLVTRNTLSRKLFVCFSLTFFFLKALWGT